MILIKTHPKNKKYFIRLKQFAQQVLDACKELKITPIVWGGLAYFAYTKDRLTVIHDIDFLVPDNAIKKIMKRLKEKGIKCNCLADWHSLVVSKKDLRIEFDPIKWYHKGPKKFREFDFNGLRVKVIGLDSLIKMYKRASKVSKDKPGQHRERLEALKTISGMVTSN